MEGGNGEDLFSTKAKVEKKNENLCTSYSCGGAPFSFTKYTLPFLYTIYTVFD